MDRVTLHPWHSVVLPWKVYWNTLFGKLQQKNCKLVVRNNVLLLMVQCSAVGTIYLSYTLQSAPYRTNMCPLIKYYIIIPLPTGINDKTCHSLWSQLLAARGGWSVKLSVCTETDCTTIKLLPMRWPSYTGSGGHVWQTEWEAREKKWWLVAGLAIFLQSWQVASKLQIL